MDVRKKREHEKAQTFTKLKDHKGKLDHLGLTHSTRLSRCVYKKLLEHKLVTLSGIPGNGKQHLALNVLKLFIEEQPGKEVMILNNYKDFKTIFDPSKTWLVLINDIVGKFKVNASLLHQWNTHLESIWSLVQSHSLFVIITTRTSVVRACNGEIVEQIFKNPYIFDLDTNTLNNDEKKEIFIQYARSYNITYTDTDLTKILSSENTGRGFPSLCSSMKNKHVVSHFLRPVDIIKEDILILKKHDIAGFVGLLMVLVCDGNMDVLSLSEEQKQFLDILQSYYGLNNIKYSLSSLQKTYIINKEETNCISFLNGLIAESTFRATIESIPNIFIRYCPILTLELLIKRHIIDRSYPSMFPFDILAERFRDGMQYDDYGVFVGCTSLWHNENFVESIIALKEFDFYSEIGEDNISFLCRFSALGYHLMVQQILNNTTTHDFAEREARKMEILKSLKNACIKKERKCVQLLIAEVENVPDYIMFAAISGGDRSVMEILLERGGDINAKHEESGECLLHAVCIKNDIDMLKLILSRCCSKLVSHKTKYSHAIPLMYAARKSCPSLFLHLLHSGSDVKTKDKFGFSCLHYALLGGKFETVKYICTHFEDMLTSKSDNGFTVAHAASQGGDIACLDFVLTLGVDHMAKANDGCTVLHISALCGKIDVVKYLCEKWDEMISFVNRYQWNAAHFAAKGNQGGCLMYLLEKGGKSMIQKTQEGYTFLHLATDINVIMYLCENYGFMLTETDKKGWNVVHYAASRGDRNSLEYLLGKGADAVCCTFDNMTILHIAASSGETDIIQFMFDSPIVQHTDMLNLESNNGFNAVFHAASKGHLECLIELGKKGYCLQKTNSQGKTILHVSAQEGRLNIVVYFCEQFSKITICHKDMFGSNAAFAAAKEGHFNCLKHLIKSGIDPLEKGDEGRTLVHIAACNGHLDILKYLYTLFEELVLMTTNTDMSAAHFAVGGGHFNCLVFLLEHGVDPFCVTEHGQTLLHTAATCGNIEILRYLCKHHKTLLSMKNKEGQNAAHASLQGNHIECLKHLLDEGKFPYDGTQLTLLHVAFSLGQSEIVKYLVGKYSFLPHVTDDNGRTPAFYAITEGHQEGLMYLLQLGSDPTTRDDENASLLHIAAGNGQLGIVIFLCETYEDLIFMTDNMGWNACHYSASAGKLDCLQYLLTKGIQPTEKTTCGKTILHLSTNMEVLKYICAAHGLMVPMTDNEGNTAGHIAVKSGQLECLECLLENGLDPLIKTDAGMTVVHLAAAEGKVNIVNFFTSSKQLNVKIAMNQMCNKNWNAAFHAAATGHLTCLKKFLHHAINHRVLTSKDRSLLHIAAHKGQLEVVKYICDVYNDMLHIKDIIKAKATFSAVHGCNLYCLIYLSRCGIDLREADKSGYTILHTATKCGHLDIVKYICTSDEHASIIYLTCNDHVSVAHNAVIYDQIECLEYVLEKGLDPHCVTIYGETLLHLAVRNDRFAIMIYLCERYEGLLQMKDNFGQNAALKAITEDQFDCLQYLVEQGIDLSCVTNEGLSLLHVASMNGKLKIVNYLCGLFQFDDITDENGYNATHYAVIHDQFDCLKCLIENGGNALACSKNGMSMLHTACYQGYLKYAEYLCTSELIPYHDLLHFEDENKANAAYYAAFSGSLECLKYVIQKGVNPYSRTTIGSTILHAAAMEDNLAIIMYICDKHSTLFEINDNDNLTPLDYADDYQSEECMIFLKARGMKKTAIFRRLMGEIGSELKETKYYRELKNK